MAAQTDELEVTDEGGGLGAAGRAGRAFKPGDYVQWGPNGILQFPEPKRITDISPDGRFVFVDGNGTGLPIDELTLQAKPAQAVPTFAPLLGKHAMRQDVFSLAEGTVTIQWPTPLSTESIQDLKDWLKIVERKITRSTDQKEPQDSERTREND